MSVCIALAHIEGLNATVLGIERQSAPFDKKKQGLILKATVGFSAIKSTSLQ